MTAVPEPSDALVEVVAEAIHRSQDGWPLAWADLHEDAQAAYLDEARAAYAALVEHLGLVEERESFYFDSKNDVVKTRLVSKWETAP